MRIWRSYSPILILAALAVVAACGNKDSMVQPIIALTPGTWGGNNVQVVVADTLMVVRVGCDQGQFTGRITPDGSGEFTANGTWTRGFQAFPSNPVPAQISGQVSGTTLVFAVAAGNDGVNPVTSTGPQTAVLGTTPSLGACAV
jgi:hypothetical protein